MTLQGLVASGDYIKTAKKSMLSMLVRKDAIVNIDQLSEDTIEQTEKFPKVIHILRGTTSISTKSQNTHANENIPVKTLASMVYPSAGTMLCVTVLEKNVAQPHTPRRPQTIFTTFSDQDLLFVQGRTESTAREIIEVTHGSVEVVPQDTDMSPITAGEQFQVDITNGKIDAPAQGSGTTYDIQNIQVVPQHTANPEPLRTLIADNHSSLATGLIAALITPNTTTNSARSDPSKGNPINSITNLTLVAKPPSLSPEQKFSYASISATDANQKFILASGNLTEINDSTLELTNSSIATDVPTNNIELASISPSSTLRGTSTDPVFCQKILRRPHKQSFTLLMRHFSKPARHSFSRPWQTTLEPQSRNS